MKKFYAIVLISLLTTAVRADDLATSFKQAVALADAQGKERAAQAYIHLDLKPYYEKKSGSRRTEMTEEPCRSRFSTPASCSPLLPRFDELC
jgi:hypothetical protein